MSITFNRRAPEQPEQPASPTAGPTKKKRVRAPKKRQAKDVSAVRHLERAVQARGALSKGDMQRAEKLIKDQRLRDDAEFAAAFNEVKHLSDDELLEQLRPWLKKRNPEHGRPSDQPKHVLYEKRILAWRYHQAGLKQKDMAQLMGISEAGVHKLIKAARKMIRVNPDQIDIPQEIGATLNIYDEIRAIGLQVMNGAKLSPNQRVMGGTLALQAQKDRVEYLKTIGVYTPQLTTVLQSLVIGQLNIQLGSGEHDMGAAVQNLAKMLMSADLSRPLEGQFAPVQSIAEQPEYDADAIETED